MNRIVHRAGIAGIACAALLGTLPLAAATAAPGPNEVVGTQHRDQLKGTAGRDLISGRARSDMLFGFRGMDLLVGGRGRDALYGSRGSDLTFGGGHADTANGGKGGDLLLELGGKDTLRGGRGQDWLVVGRARDAVWSGRGRDLVLLLNDDRSDVIRCGARRDVVVTFRGRDEKDVFVACERIVRAADLDAQGARGVAAPRVLTGSGAAASSTLQRATPDELPSDPVKLGRHFLR